MTYSFFDWKFYIDLYPDLKQNGIDNRYKAIEHWETFGKSENRICYNIKKLVDFVPIIYFQLNPDLGLAGINTKTKLLEHWLSYGFKEGRKCKYEIAYRFKIS